jgi:hypothetical protein
MGKQRSHLVLALSQLGFGEAILGMRLADDLRKAGDSVFFLAHDSNKLLFSGTPHLTFGSHVSQLLPWYISSCAADIQASSIILSDYHTTTYFFMQFGLAPETLTALGLPIFGIDTWDSTRSGDIDVFVNSIQAIQRWSIGVNTICPAPFLGPDATTTVYGSVPDKVLLSKKERKSLRGTLGISEDAKIVLMCSAEWQHAHYESDAANRLAVSLPRLMADYLSRIGQEVHLVHIGPRAFDLNDAMAGRYHWMPPLAPEHFDKIVAIADLLFSANISATTIAKAMAYEVPVLVVHNSVSAGSREEAESVLACPPSPYLQRWLNESTPLFPFLLWPLGYRRFVAPLLQNNPYMNGVEFLELLDEQRIEAALRSLLFDRTARQEQAQRQGAYLATVKSLPTGVQAIRARIDS